MRPPILFPAPFAALPALALLMLAGCGASGGSYPSLLPRAAEIPRDIAAPGEGVQPSLGAEQQQSLRADLIRERSELDLAQQAIRDAGAMLDRALSAARGSQPGSDNWGSAQMALSRFDVARSSVGDIRARLAPLERTVDSLPADDPDRRDVLDLAARAADVAARAASQSEAAARALGS